MEESIKMRVERVGQQIGRHVDVVRVENKGKHIRE